MSLRIFIGWDSRFPDPARVLAYSLLKHASEPLDIRFLDYRHLQTCYGFNREYDPRATTEFTYSRFLVPWLCGFGGVALFLDNDMACFTDIAELFEIAQGLLADNLALAVVKHDHQVVDGSTKMYGAVQTAYPRKNWSSLMMMNCRRLLVWDKPAVEKASGAFLHRFERIPDEEILALDPAWNSLDHMDAKTKIIHWTSGGPWYKEYEDCPHAQVWRDLRDELRSDEGDGEVD